MVDYFVAAATPTTFVDGRAGGAGVGVGVKIESFSPGAPEALLAPQVEELKSLLIGGSVQSVRQYLIRTHEQLCDFNKFNAVLLSANNVSQELSKVCMDVILKTLNAAPIVRLVGGKGDFCVVRFDR